MSWRYGLFFPTVLRLVSKRDTSINSFHARESLDPRENLLRLFFNSQYIISISTRSYAYMRVRRSSIDFQRIRLYLNLNFRIFILTRGNRWHIHGIRVIVVLIRLCYGYAVIDYRPNSHAAPVAQNSPTVQYGTITRVR